MQHGVTFSWEPWADTPALRADWLALLARMPEAPIFLHPEWLACAADAGVCRPARVLVVRRDDRPIALFPLLASGPLAWALPDPLCLDTAIRLLDPDDLPAAWAGVAAAMRATPTLGHLALGRVNTPECLAALQAALGAHGLPVRPWPIDPTLHIALAADWSSYVAGLGRSTRDKLRHLDAYRRRESDAVAVGPVTDPEEITVVLEGLITFYRRHWGGQIGGSVLCQPSFADFFRAVVRWAIACDAGALLAVRYHGRLLAAGTVLHLPGQATAYFQLMARDEEPGTLPPALGSPGIVLTAGVIQWAIARGARVLSMGRGTTHYKQWLGGVPVPLWQPTVARSRLADAVVPSLARAAHLLTRVPVHARALLARY